MTAIVRPFRRLTRSSDPYADPDEPLAHDEETEPDESDAAEALASVREVARDLESLP